MGPKVSVILPVYNGKKYIRESIDSILKQSFTDWELIIVNDCSTDGTAEILAEYAAMDNRIAILHNAVNQKLPRSLNIGFSKARGEYLTWTSDDNHYLPDALQVMVEYLEKNAGEAIVRCDYYFIDAEGKRIGESEKYSDFDMYRWNCFGACFLYRREVRETVGEYNTNAFGVEDYDYWLRILEKYGTIHSIEKRLYEYRRHEGSLSVTKRHMVICELARLRERCRERLFYLMADHKDELCRMYYEMLPAETFRTEFKEWFVTEIPELKGDIGFTERRSFLIFGAGIYGGRAEHVLADKAVYFVDNDRNKAGQTKCGKKILSFDEAMTLSDQYDFFIAIEGKYLYEVICQLHDAGISEYTTFQSYMKGYEGQKNE